MNTEKNKEQLTPDVSLSAEEQHWLIQQAKQAITDQLKDTKPEFDDSELSPMLKAERALFVTLKKNDRLRGCIGHIQPMGSLASEVRKVACLAAFEDPRFPNVELDEVKDLHFEITSMSPMRQVKKFNLIEPGTHGLMIRKGYYQGLLLPQVATEYGWNREEFLSHTCVKAGLPPDEWRRKPEVFVFTAFIFNDSEA